MRTVFLFSATVVSVFLSNVALSQSGESKFKRVIINPNEKIITPLFPSFKINDLSYTDANRNGQLDADEEGSIGFYIKNSGTILLSELTINLNVPDSIKGISFSKTKTVKQISPGDSILVNIPLTSDEKLKDGRHEFLHGELRTL